MTKGDVKVEPMPKQSGQVAFGKGNEMEAVIRHPVSKLYRCVNGVWSDDWKKAQHFSHATDAMSACIKEHIDAYEIVMKHSTSERDDLVVSTHTPSHTHFSADPRTHVFRTKSPANGTR